MSDNDALDVTSPYEDIPTVPHPQADGESTQFPMQIGRYRVERVLGRGGFGLVYLAYDEQLGRPVAIKVPHANLLSRADDAELYLREARTVANLDHPHIVPVLDVGSTAETPFFVVSKYIEGADLATILRDSRLSYQQAAEMLATVAEALHHAHRQGLVHRDIKPGNILLDKNGKPFVVDFGLALREQDVGKGASYVGTPAYMSPEQARGEGHRVDGRSDIFSLGVVFYELLVGRRPFKSDSKVELLDEIINQEPRPPRQLDDSVPKELDRICLKMLSKRASERYSTARDAAEDLRHFSKEIAGDSVTSLASNLLSRAPITASNFKDSTPAATPTSDRKPIKIVPKGLRSFDGHDADFFLELLPGPRDRDGLPDSIRFWKTRIEETDADRTFSVGLIYGPSGCGKTSLVKAGLLPRLSENVIPVYIEATAVETENRLLRGLRKGCPALPNSLSLKDTLAALRHGEAVSVGKNVLIVVDQFEQWLHAKNEEENTELLQALRQCDGSHVQCIIMVRDDFWLAVSRFLKGLEIRLLEGQNSALTDLFDSNHARKVLAAFGRAFGRLPEGDLSKDQREFLKQSVAGLAEDGKVVCVRLALFAEMMKSKEWTLAGLKAVGGTQGVGVTFLEETFSASTAPPEHRYHQKASRAVLMAMLPESGTDIKGNMRSCPELLEASGYGSRPKEFDDLIRILDNEVRLITPTAPDGVEADITAVSKVAANQKYYQLTHDYLVPSLRNWLTRKQTETRRGRAELRLAERSALWNNKPENRYLPSLLEYLNIRLLTNSKNWTEPQRRIMKTGGRVQAMRSGITSAVLIVLLLATWEITGRFKAGSLVGHLITADISGVPELIEKLATYRRWADSYLQQEDEKAQEGSRQKLHLALALLPDEAKIAYLREQLVLVTPIQFPVVRDALLPNKVEIVESLWTLALDLKQVREQRFQAACALATFASDDSRWTQIGSLVANHLVTRQASDFLAWREALRPAKQQLLKPLGSIYRDQSQKEQSRIYATETLADYSSGDPNTLFDLLTDAEQFQFSLVFDNLAPNKQQAIALARQELKKRSEEKASEDEKEALAKRQANAGVALYRMGDYETVWPLLKFSPDPRVRSYIIHLIAPLGGDPPGIIERLDSEPDVTIRRALFLTLGEFNDTQLPSTDRMPLIEKLLSVYESEPDAGLHGAVEWLLRKWGHGDQIQAAVKKLRSNEEKLRVRKAEDKKQWYVNTQGQTFVIVDASEFLMGSQKSEPWHNSNEIQQRRRLERRFAIATTELTREAASRGPSVFTPDSNFVKTKDSPETGFDWYGAVQYCNWLSEQEGIPKDEWCYEPNEEGNYAAGMKARANFMDLHGYRLPTEAEWEYACRAGTETSRYYGLTEALLPNYAWYLANARNRLWPGGSLKPNDLGLFDMLGNAFEWCHDRFYGYQPVASQAEEVIGKTDNDRRVLRGGAFLFQPLNVRSAYRSYIQPVDRSINNGFRLARTYP